MAYRLSAGDQPVSHQIHRLFLEEIDSAIGHLTEATAENRDHKVHEARKNIKKVRAVIRLIAHQLGRRSFRRENHRFRDIGRKLSELRDAQAMIESFAALPEQALSKALRTRLGKSLEAAKANTYSTLHVDDVLQSSIAVLQAARQQLESFSLEAEGFSVIEPGLLKIYRQGRKAMTVARENCTPENLHNFRKRVKDHWYHMRLLAEAQIALLDGRQDALRILETDLGESHNLHVLQQTLMARKPTKKFLAALQARESELAVQALALGEQLYERKPRQLKKELLELHSIWSNHRKRQRAAAPKPPASENDFPTANAALA